MILLPNLPLLEQPRVLGTRNYRFGSERWRVVRLRVSEEEYTDGVRIYRNGRLVLSRTGEYEYDAVLIRWPYPGKLLALSRHSSAGHGMHTWFYRTDSKGVTNLRVSIQSEVGGPEFRDVDHDGRPEVLFDNYDWYSHFDHSSPTFLYAFKYDGKRLWLWRKLPNPTHQRLPNRLPFF